MQSVCSVGLSVCVMCMYLYIISADIYFASPVANDNTQKDLSLTNIKSNMWPICIKLAGYSKAFSVTLAVIFGRKISQIIRCLKVKYTDPVREFYAKEYDVLGNVACCEVTYILLLVVENIKYIGRH